MRAHRAVGIVSVFIVAGCSGVSPTQVGQTAGGIAGSFIVPGIGGTVGALVGTLAGLMVEGHVDKAREQHERVALGHELTASPEAAHNAPPVGTPTRVWVDEDMRNGRLTAGHFEMRPLS
jgi:hypothetical protein